MVRQPEGTVTFLFSDIEGSTRLLERLGPDRYAEALELHRRLLRETFERHGGYEVDVEGDAFFVSFASASEAVVAAAEAQQALASATWSDGAPIRVRMGIHTGEPLLAPPRYVGLDVHKAARIMAAAHGGQVLLSSSVRAFLPPGEVRDLGEHRLKDFDEPTTLFQLGTDEFPPLKTISNTNLPRPASSFIGRTREIAEVTALFRDGARLVTLTGPGGTGKTRLAIESAGDLVGEFPAGVFWVGLASLRDPGLVLETIAQTLGAKADLEIHVGERELLLLLDNLEQVIDAAPELAGLVEACPNLRLLVTSRELLRVRGEVEYELLPLAEPDAVELFCARAQVAAGPAVEELCRRLDNLPLALELAAARANVLTPEQILERLAERLDLLRGGRDADPRQATLRATIEWSYDLLNEQEQATFLRLSSFTGSFELEAAETVARADLDVMSALVDKSLVRRVPEGRFFLLETIRELGVQELEQRGELDQVRQDHAQYYIRLADDLATAPYAPFDEAWSRRFPLEEPQLRTAFAALRDSGKSEELQQMCAALWWTWDHFGRLDEGRARIQEALERTTADRLRHALLEVGLSVIAWRQGDATAAVAAAEQAVLILRDLDDRPQLVHALRALSNGFYLLDDFVPADRALAEYTALARAVGDVTSECTALVNRGGYALARGDDATALELSTAAVELAVAHGLADSEAVARHNCGAAHFRSGRIDAAEIAFKASLVAYGDQIGAWMALFPVDSLAAVAARRSEFRRAARLLGAASRIQGDTGVAFTAAQAEIHEEAVAATLVALGPDRYAEVSGEGAALSLEDLVREALGEPSAVLQHQL